MPKYEGHYKQGADEHPVKFKSFKLKKGVVKGRGKDDVGRFHILGSYDEHGAVKFTKQYEGAHAVEYTGHNNGEHIEGHWHVMGMSDAFKISVRNYPL